MSLSTLKQRILATPRTGRDSARPDDEVIRLSRQAFATLSTSQHTGWRQLARDWNKLLQFIYSPTRDRRAQAAINSVKTHADFERAYACVLRATTAPDKARAIKFAKLIVNTLLNDKLGDYVSRWQAEERLRARKVEIERLEREMK